MPSARGSSGEPGTANTSRPCSSAIRAVISEPERRAASTTTTPTRQSGDQPVAAGKVAGARLPAERHFGDRGAVGQDGVGEAGMFGRIDAIVAAGQHGDGAAAEARTMRGGVDAARQARDDGEAGVAEIARESLGETHAGGRGVARTDDGDHRPVERRRSAAHGEQRRRVVDHLQPARIVRLAQRDEADAERLRRRELALGILARNGRGQAESRRRAGRDRAAPRAPRARRRND